MLHSAAQSSLGAIVATADGNLALWPNLGELDSQDPLAAHLAAELTCISTCAGADADLSALIGSKAGKLFWLHCATRKSPAAPPAVSVDELQVHEVRLITMH